MPGNDKASQIARARSAAGNAIIADVGKDENTIWAFCVWCSHSQLFDMTWLIAQAKDRTAPLSEIETRLKCMKCERHGVRLIPTPRTMVNFDRLRGG
jgi:hypothetical protein